METEAGKEGYMIGRCHQGAIEDGYSPPLNVVDRVAVDTAQRSSVQSLPDLGAFLNRFVAFNFSGSSRVLAFCSAETVLSRKKDL